MLVEPIGHQKVREALERELPSVTLLLGPASVGKRTLAQYLVRYHGTLVVDTRFVDPLTADAARDLKYFSLRAPFGPFKVALVRLDGASDISLNTLLKVLEEPPPRLKFILFSSTKVLTTIASRSHVFRVGLLSVEELERILVERMGMSDQYAATAARLGGGQVSAAARIESSDSARASVLTVLKALSDKDKDLFDQALKSWDLLAGERVSPEQREKARELARELLICWAREAITGKWCVFSESETFGLAQDKVKVRKVLTALHRLPGARAKLSVRVALEPFLVK